MTPELSSALSSVITQLADFFGMSTQIIMENAPYWLARYGWFACLNDLGISMFIGILVVGIIVVFYFGIKTEWGTDLNEVSNSHLIRNIILITVAVEAIMIILHILPCAVAPEMYGLTEILALIGG